MGFHSYTGGSKNTAMPGLQYNVFGGGGGTTGGAGGVGGSPTAPRLPSGPGGGGGGDPTYGFTNTPAQSAASTQVSTPPAPQYQPGAQYGPNTYRDPNLTTLAQAGTGLLDPSSDYYQRLNEGMRAQIGQESGAAQRAAALRAAQSGMGVGASPELLETQGLIGRGGLQAMGAASADLRLRAPELGGQLTAATFGPTQQQFGRDEQSKQFGFGQAQQAGQFGAGLASGQWGTGLQAAQAQQGQAAQQAQFQAQLTQQQQQLQMQRYLAELNMGMGGIG